LQIKLNRIGLFGIILLKKKENGKDVLDVMKSNWLILIFLLVIKLLKMDGIVFVNVVEIKRRTKYNKLYKTFLRIIRKEKFYGKIKRTAIGC